MSAARVSLTALMVARLGSWGGIAGVIAASFAAPRFVGMDASTYALSVLALTFSQLVLIQACQREARADQRERDLQKKIDGIIHGTGAPDELAGLEERHERERGKHE